MKDVNPPAGWYKSPTEENLLRWWDGDSWTDVTKTFEEVARQAPEPVKTGVEKLTDDLPKPKAEQILDYVVGGSLAAGGAAIAVDGAANLVKKKTGAGKWFIFSAFMILSSVLMSVQAIAGFFGPERTETAGMVVEIIQDPDTDNWCLPVVEYSIAGQKMRAQLSDYEACRWTDGSEISVFYDAGTKGRNVMLEKATESWETLSTSVSAFLIGIFFLIVGLVKLGARAVQAGVGAFVAKKGYDKLKKTSKGE